MDKSIESPLESDQYLAEAIGIDILYWQKYMTAAERDFVRRFPYEIKWIDRTKKSKDGKIKPNNDFIFIEERCEYELKTPDEALYRPISRMIRGSRKNGKDHFIIDLGNKSLTSILVKNLEKYNQRNPKWQITKLKIFSKGKIITIKLKT